MGLICNNLNTAYDLLIEITIDILGYWNAYCDPMFVQFNSRAVKEPSGKQHNVSGKNNGLENIGGASAQNNYCGVA